MTPEAADYLRTSHVILADAQKAATLGMERVAVRDSYLADLNAARALIFERLTIAAKSHSGTISLFGQLLRDGLAFDPDLAGALTEGFDKKSKVDYGPYSSAEFELAEHAVERAVSFIAAVERLLI